MHPYRTPCPPEYKAPSFLQQHRQHLLLSVLAGAITLPLGLAIGGCNPGQREAARTALDVLQTTCLIAHQFLPDTEALKACDIAEPFYDPARKILAGARVASAEAVAGARTAGGVCAPDSGVQCGPCPSVSTPK